MCYKTTFKVAVPGKLRGAPMRQEGEKLITAHYWNTVVASRIYLVKQMQATACSQAAQHSVEACVKPAPALQAETQPSQPLWLLTWTSYSKGTAVSQQTDTRPVLLFQ